MHFYVDGSITFGDKRIYRMPRDRYFCRELALSAFRRQTLGSIPLLGKSIHTPLLYLLALQRLPTQMEMNVYPQRSDRCAVPPRFIIDVQALLATYYPSVIFENTEMQAAGFHPTLLQGYTLRGNSQIIPAFFWSLFFFREVIERSHIEYTNLAALLDSMYDDDADEDDEDNDSSFTQTHKRAFERLLAGTEPPADTLLASGNGPIDTFEGREQSSLIAHLARIERQDAMRCYEEILNNVITS